jgi:hypothetical protein
VRETLERKPEYALPIKQPGGTDHTSFTWIGLPGFGFIQDPMEYQTRTHHSNMDLYDRVQPGDLMQGSAIMAWFVYNTANRAEMMPVLILPYPSNNRQRREARQIRDAMVQALGVSR